MSTATYPEYCWSPWHQWFVDLGYPLLDINRYQDGEWAIIQWLKYPVIPSATEWQNVLSGIRNVDITRGFVQKFVRQVDMERKFFWDREEAKSQGCEDEWEATEDHAEEMATEATKAVMGNEDIKRRIAEKGLGEIHPLKIAKNIPHYQW